MANDLWATPKYIFDWLDREFHFTIDCAANEINTKCKRWYDEECNSLKQFWSDWDNEVRWLNPPYSNPSLWVQKAYEESLKGCTVVCLLPSDTSTKWFHEWVIGKAEVRFVQGRICFECPDGNGGYNPNFKNSPTFGSVIIIYKNGIIPKCIGVKRPDKPKPMLQNNQTQSQY